MASQNSSEWIERDTVTSTETCVCGTSGRRAADHQHCSAESDAPSLGQVSRELSKSANDILPRVEEGRGVSQENCIRVKVEDGIPPVVEESAGENMCHLQLPIWLVPDDGQSGHHH